MAFDYVVPRTNLQIGRGKKNLKKFQMNFRNTVIPRLVRSLRVRILGTRSIEDVQNNSQCAF